MSVSCCSYYNSLRCRPSFDPCSPCVPNCSRVSVSDRSRVCVFTCEPCPPERKQSYKISSFPSGSGVSASVDRKSKKGSSNGRERSGSRGGTEKGSRKNRKGGTDGGGPGYRRPRRGRGNTDEDYDGPDESDERNERTGRGRGRPGGGRERPGGRNEGPGGGHDRPGGGSGRPGDNYGGPGRNQGGPGAPQGGNNGGYGPGGFTGSPQGGNNGGYGPGGFTGSPQGGNNGGYGPGGFTGSPQGGNNGGYGPGGFSGSPQGGNYGGGFNGPGGGYGGFGGGFGNTGFNSGGGFGSPGFGGPSGFGGGYGGFGGSPFSPYAGMLPPCAPGYAASIGFPPPCAYGYGMANGRSMLPSYPSMYEKTALRLPPCVQRREIINPYESRNNVCTLRDSSGRPASFMEADRTYRNYYSGNGSNSYATSYGAVPKKQNTVSRRSCTPLRNISYSFGAVQNYSSNAGQRPGSYRVCSTCGSKKTW